MSRDLSKGLLGPDPKKDLFPRFEPTVKHTQLPNSYSYEYLFGAIENQLSYGSCVTFATTALLEAILYKRTGNRVDTSEAALYSLTKHYESPDNLTEQGLFAGDALYIMQTTGYVLDSDRPYPTDPTDAYMLEIVPSSIIKTDHDLSGFLRVDSNPEHMQLALLEHGPIAIGIPFAQEWFTPDSNGFLSSSPTSIAGGHEMVIVGYSKTKRAFRVRNSWGLEWGDKGYCWLPFNIPTSFLPDDAYCITI